MELLNNEKLSCELQYIVVDDVPWFRGSAVANALKYETQKDAIKRHVRDKHKTRLKDFDRLPVSGSPKIDVKSWFISEPGLYSLKMHSKMKLANDFQDWVFETVLPSIRKTGKYTVKEHPVRKRLTFKIETEFDLQSKVVNFIKNTYPASIFTSTLGENQDTAQKRMNSHSLGYLKGSPDLLITNCHKKHTGFAIEFKNPRGTGVISDEQRNMLDKYKANNWKTLISNDYDECIIQLIEYFTEVRVKCEFCTGKFKSRKTLENHKKYSHRIE